MVVKASKNQDKKSTKKLLQVKVDSWLKDDLELLANYKGISISSFVKLTLTEGVRNGKRKLITENGLTVAEEMELLKMAKEGGLAYKTGEVEALAYDELIKELDSDSPSRGKIGS